jgi:hypothetical protein
MGLGIARMVGRAIPTIVEELTPLARRLAAHGGLAEDIANSVVKARNLGGQIVGTMLRETEPVVNDLSATESASLAGALLRNEQPIGRAATLLEQGNRLAQRTGREFGTELRDRAADLSPKIATNGPALFQRALHDESDALTRHVVTERLGPLVDQLPEGPQQILGRQLVNSVEHGTGGTGQLAGLRAFNTATMLGRAVLLNSTQPALSAAVAGLGPASRAAMQMATSGGRAEVRDLAMRLGTAIDTGLTDFLRQESGSGIIGRTSSEVLRRTGFNAVERLNRQVATAIGDQWFGDLTRQASTSPWAARQLERHGVRRLADFTAGDRAQFVQNFVRRTQFRMTPEELPGFMSARGFPAEVLRTAFQFKPFALKATELLVDELREQPAGFLARTLGLGATVGLPASELRRLTSGSKEGKEAGIPRRLFDAVVGLGAAGMFYDAIMAAQGGERRVLEFFAGPTASTAAEFASGAARAAQGEPRSLARAALRRVPVVGPYASGLILPRPETARGRRIGPVLP